MGPLPLAGGRVLVVEGVVVEIDSISSRTLVRLVPALLRSKSTPWRSAAIAVTDWYLSSGRSAQARRTTWPTSSGSSTSAEGTTFAPRRSREASSAGSSEP